MASHSGGGFTCCVPGCFSNSKRDVNLSFYGFPKENNLRKRWLHKISRKNFSPSTGHRVCSLHFEGGKKTYMNNVPVIFPLAKSHPRPSPKPRRKVILHRPSTSNQETPPTFNLAASSTTENDESERDDTQQQIERLREELKNVLRLKESLEHDLFVIKFGLRRFKDSDKDMSYYTGLTYGQFVALFKFLNAHDICHRPNYWGSDYAKIQLPESEKRGQKRSLEPEDELFLTLCRLRVNIPEKVLADNYNMSVSEVSRIFATWLDLLYSRLIQLPVWATKKTNEETVPEVFQQKYPLTRVILDCTELFIEKPSCFRAQSDTYSTYKSHNTAKGLVAIAPNGALTFISDLYGGHCSDKTIVEHCGILQLLEEGDSVMADRGFEIQDLLAPRKVYLNISPFMRSKDQLNPDEEDETREIASVRIHVERAIERVKNCNILKQILPNSMSEDIDKIWKVCCLLSNFKGPLVV